jgi:hypothetical protein
MTTQSRVVCLPGLEWSGVASLAVPAVLAALGSSRQGLSTQEAGGGRA